MFPTVYAVVPHGISPTIYTVDILWGHIPWGTILYTVGNMIYTVGNHRGAHTLYTVGNIEMFPTVYIIVPHGISPTVYTVDILWGHIPWGTIIDHIYCGSMSNIPWATWYIPWGTTVGNIPYIPWGTLKCSPRYIGLSPTVCCPRYISLIYCGVHTVGDKFIYRG